MEMFRLKKELRRLATPVGIYRIWAIRLHVNNMNTISQPWSKDIALVMRVCTFTCPT
jgi:uncharacterized protein YcsI (UPF0317 family)